MCKHFIAGLRSIVGQSASAWRKMDLRWRCEPGAWRIQEAAASAERKAPIHANNLGFSASMSMPISAKPIAAVHKYPMVAVTEFSHRLWRSNRRYFVDIETP